MWTVWDNHKEYISVTSSSKLRADESTPLDEALLQTQTSVSENFPSKLRDKLRSHTQEVTHKTIGSGPEIDLDCIKCPSKKVTYAQVQLRSADEGSTIFYACVQCGHRWVGFHFLSGSMLMSSHRWQENNWCAWSNPHAVYMRMLVRIKWARLEKSRRDTSSSVELFPLSVIIWFYDFLGCLNGGYMAVTN